MAENQARRELRLPLKNAVRDLWREGRRELTLRLEGQSMAPVALDGDRVTIQPVQPERFRCGDIIALQLGQTIVVHRFLMARTAADGRRWHCQKGDNSPAWSWVLPESLLGRVTLIEGPRRCLRLSSPPWSWFDPLAGRLSCWRVLLAGGGQRRGDGFRDAVPLSLGRHPFRRLAGSLRRGLISPLIRLAHFFQKNEAEMRN